MSLGHEDEMVSCSHVLQRLRNAGNNLNRVLGNLMSEAADLFMHLGRDRIRRKLLKRLDQRMRKAVQGVAVLENGLARPVVQHQPHLLRRIFAMIEERNKLRDRAFKINIVFPERVIRVDEQSLGAIPVEHDYHDTGCEDAATLWTAMLGK